MQLDRSVLRASLAVGTVAGAIAGAWLVHQSTHAAKHLPAESTCRQMLDATATADPEVEVRALEQLARLGGCRAEAEDRIDIRARWFHHFSNKEPAGLRYAARLYDAYLAAFPKGPHFAEDQYYRAEVAWAVAEAEPNARLQTEDWEAAAVAFDQVVATRKVELALLREAAYAAVLAHKNILGTHEPPATEDTTPIALPPDRQAFIAACRAYRAIASDDEAVSMLFLEANMLRRYRHFDEAIPMFLEIVNQHRSHETAEYAANLALDSYNLLGRYSELVALARSLMTDHQFLADKPDLASVLEKIDRKARGPHAGEH